LSLYTEWYWQIDLHNLFHFIKLRMDPHAQYEIRVYAEALAECAKAVAPIAYEAFEEHILGSVAFSRTECEALATMLAGGAVDLKGKSLEAFEAKVAKLKTAVPVDQTRYRAVRWWLLSIAALIAVMVLVGGATRLTESGLSIVEWKPVTGALPPLGETQWTQAFEAYQTIPQYRAMNAGMSLAEFKTIFWWEWSHRLLGRVIGIAYLLPFLWFMWRGVLAADLRRRLWLIFGLGALQGAVGWWMVASGLSQRVEVSHYRLAAHLVLALLIFAAIVWTLRRLADRLAMGK